MSDPDQEILKIDIPVEEEAERPFVPEQPDTVGKVKESVTETVRQAWQSNTRKQATRQIRRGATTVVSKSSRFVSEKVAQTAEQQARNQVEAVQSRLRETDWKHEAKTGTANGLRWLSQKLARLAERFTPGEETPPPDNK